MRSGLLLAAVIGLLAGCNPGAPGADAPDASPPREHVLGVRQAEEFASLSEMATSADAVVIATVSGVAPGRILAPGDAPPMQLVDVTLDVQEVIAGQMAGSLTVEIDPILFPDREAPTRIWPVIGSRYLLFLRLKGDAQAPEAYRLIHTAGLFLLRERNDLIAFDGEEPLALSIAELGLAGARAEIASITH